MVVGKSIQRVDAVDKAVGRAHFTDDLCPPDALTAKILHAPIAHGMVRKIDISRAERIKGVVKVLTCFDVPKHTFPTDGHLWHPNEEEYYPQCDRHLLTQHVRYFGDDVAAVIAEDPVAADQALRAIEVTYDELPVVLDAREAAAPGAPQLFEDKPGNVCGETAYDMGNYDEAIREEGLLVFDRWYHTPRVQHCHLENSTCFAYQEGVKIAIVSSTQIPHIVRRVVGQALGIPWGNIRVIKPYIGGGFGNKQDVLYEPLCAWLCTQVGGRCVRLENTREETFANTRIRHSYDIHLTTHVRKDGVIVARAIEEWCHQGAYTSHGHGVTENSLTTFQNLYPYCARRMSAHTIFTNSQPSGAMRAYGFPQCTFAVESQMEEMATALGMDSIEFRRKNMMGIGHRDEFLTNQVYQDSLNQCIDKGLEAFKYYEKKKQYENQTGEIRRGVGMAIFFYTSGVFPVAVETDTCRMVLNQDGSVQLMLGDTEIGQGADTAFSQMAADVIGVPVEKIHIVSTQDTDVTPLGLGAFASRQTFVASFSIDQTGSIFREKLLERVRELTGEIEEIDIADGIFFRKSDRKEIMTIEVLGCRSIYNAEKSVHITAESTATVKHNAFNYGCSFAEVEVDIPMCRVSLLNIMNVHDCGKLINPQLAEAQVHGGMSMGIGYGMSEELLHDRETGRLLNGNLLDYKLSSFMDHPRLNALFVENEEPVTPFGNRSLGEPPAITPAPAIRNAIMNATGAALNRIPMTPKVLFEFFRENELI